MNEKLDIEFDAVGIRVLDAGEGWVHLEASIEHRGRKLLTLPAMQVLVGDEYSVRLGGVATGPLISMT